MLWFSISVTAWQWVLCFHLKWVSLWSILHKAITVPILKFNSHSITPLLTNLQWFPPINSEIQNLYHQLHGPTWFIPYHSVHTGPLAVFITAYNRLPTQNVCNYCLLCLELSSSKQPMVWILDPSVIHSNITLERPFVVGRMLWWPPIFLSPGAHVLHNPPPRVWRGSLNMRSCHSHD